MLQILALCNSQAGLSQTHCRQLCRVSISDVACQLVALQMSVQCVYGVNSWQAKRLNRQAANLCALLLTLPRWLYHCVHVLKSMVTMLCRLLVLTCAALCP